MKHPATTRSAIALSLTLALVACANGGGLDDAPGSDLDASVAEPSALPDSAPPDADLRPTRSASEAGAGAGVDAASFDAGVSIDADVRDSASAVDGSDRADAAAIADAAPTHDASVVDAGVLLDGGARDASTPTCLSHGFTGVLATFDLTGQPGAETSAAATSFPAGVRGASLARSAALNATAGSGSINASNWPTSASADPNAYYALVVTPDVGCALDLTSLALDTRASSTGPTSGDVATNADGFASHVGTFAATGTTTVALSRTGGAGPLEVRIYGFDASGASGTFRLQNAITLSGTIR